MDTFHPPPKSGSRADEEELKHEKCEESKGKLSHERGVVLQNKTGDFIPDAETYIYKAHYAGRSAHCESGRRDSKFTIEWSFQSPGQWRKDANRWGGGERRKKESTRRKG